MLVNLTPIQSEIDRCKKIAKENNFKYTPQSDPKWLQETGIYQSSMAFNFPDYEFEELKGTGIALGVINQFKYEENVKTGLKEGQIIAIGTDGIWEAFDKNGKMFGKDRFRDIIRQNAQATADDILDAVYRELSQFTKGRKCEDDITLVVIKVKRFISCEKEVIK